MPELRETSRCVQEIQALQDLSAPIGAARRDSGHDQGELVARQLEEFDAY